MTHVSDQQPIHAQHETDRPTLGLYISGFILSLVFTLGSFFLVEAHLHHNNYSRAFLIGATAVLALAQFFVQLYCFLHLGHETRPRWKLLVLIFMILVVLILVFGSLWIMYNLNYHMTSQQMNTYMRHQDGGV